MKCTHARAELQDCTLQTASPAPLHDPSSALVAWSSIMPATNDFSRREEAQGVRRPGPRPPPGTFLLVMYFHERERELQVPVLWAAVTREIRVLPIPSRQENLCIHKCLRAAPKAAKSCMH